MTMINEELIGNLSTILKIIIITVIPAAFLEQVDAGALATVLAGIIMFVFSIIDAKFSNTFEIFNNANETLETEDMIDEGV